MNSEWVSLGVGILSSVITAAVVAAVNYAALKAWMATREATEKELVKDVDDHEHRIRDLERQPRQPMDYAR